MWTIIVEIDCVQYALHEKDHAIKSILLAYFADRYEVSVLSVEYISE